MQEVAKKRQEMTQRSLAYHFPAKKTRCLGKQVLLEVEIKNKIVRKCREFGGCGKGMKEEFRVCMPDDNEGGKRHL